MELPHGGEGWQQLRQGYLPPEFTAGEWRASSCGRKWLVGGDNWAHSPATPDMALPCGQACLLSCVLSSP